MARTGKTRNGKTQTGKMPAGKSGVADVVFEGVLIPKDTRSAKLAKKGITNEEEMGKFLTALFADTLKGEIILPKTNSEIDAPSRILNGLEEKVKLGLPVGIQAVSSIKRPREAGLKKFGVKKA